MIYKATGNLRAIQILLGHTKIENTVKYLGVDIEDALELAEHTEICTLLTKLSQFQTLRSSGYAPSYRP